MSQIVLALFVTFISVADVKGPSGPSSTVRITEIQPAVGSTFGGTPITVSGEGFTSSAVVTIGGAFATDVVIVSNTTLTARSTQHAAATVDVVVNVSGRSASLSQAFT